MWLISCWALSMKIRFLINPVRMRSSTVSMAPRRPAEWVDSSTSDSGPSATQPEHITPVYPCFPATAAQFDDVVFGGVCSQSRRAFFFLNWIFLPKHLLVWKTKRWKFESLCEEGDVVVRVSHSWSKVVDWFVNLTQNECKPTHGFRFW